MYRFIKPQSLGKCAHDGKHEVGHRPRFAGESQAFFDEFDADTPLGQRVDQATQVVNNVGSPRCLRAATSIRISGILSMGA